jgi:integrase
MRGLIAACPHFEWFKIPPAKFDFLTFEEADRLLQAATEEERTMILVALRTGLRFGELVALRWEDVDLVAGKVMVRRRLYRGTFDTPKSGKPREVPLSEDARAALKRHRHLRGELVFCDLDGRPFSHRVATNALSRALKRAGLRSMGWHSLRHTFASQLAMAGAPLKAIQELLGHANIQMTMRYAHLAPEIARDSVQLLDRRSNFDGRGSVVAATP